jgi:uncharacterized MnhB-related membrane protein
MTTLQVVAYTAVMVLGVTVAFSFDPVRQVFANTVFGLALTVLFVVLQAPDVALSELVVGTVVIPLVVLAAIVKTARGRGDE